jgi:hypothetical protein
MEKQQVLVFRDEVFESETLTGVTKTIDLMQAVVNEFNSLNLGNVQPNELERLIRNPQKLYDERLLLIEIPKGLSRNKYLQLMDLPTPDFVIKRRNELLNSPWAMEFNLFYLEDGTVKVNDKDLTALINSRNVYMDEKSDSYKFLTGLTDFVRFYNELNELSGFELIKPAPREPLAQWFRFTQIQGTYSSYRLVIDRDKLLRLLKLWEKSNSKEQLKNTSHA